MIHILLSLLQYFLTINFRKYIPVTIDLEINFPLSYFGEIYQSGSPSGRVAQKIRNTGSRVPEQWLNLLWIIH